MNLFKVSTFPSSSAASLFKLCEVNDSFVFCSPETSLSEKIVGSDSPNTSVLSSFNVGNILSSSEISTSMSSKILNFSVDFCFLETNTSVILSFNVCIFPSSSAINVSKSCNILNFFSGEVKGLLNSWSSETFFLSEKVGSHSPNTSALSCSGATRQLLGSFVVETWFNAYSSFTLSLGLQSIVILFIRCRNLSNSESLEDVDSFASCSLGTCSFKVTVEADSFNAIRSPSLRPGTQI